MWVPLVWNRSLDGVRAYNTVVFDDQPAIIVADPHHPGPARRQRRVAATAGPDRGLLIDGDHVLVGTQRFPVPLPGVQVEHPLSLGLEVRVGDEDPGLVLPGF